MTDTTKTLDLDALQRLADAATAGPWEVGAYYVVAGVGGRFRNAPDECGYCHRGEPVWTGRADINGVTMEAHEHLLTEGFEGNLSISGTDAGNPHVTVVHGSSDYGPNLSREDAEFIAAARTAMPALIAEVRQLRVEVDGSHDEIGGLKGDLELQTAAAFDNQAEIERLRGALKLIAGDRCSNYTRGSCRDEGSGRSRIAPHLADQWCDACIAADGLQEADRG